MKGRESESKRVRRDPEEARSVILDAAERVFAEKGPDAAGLKDVAAMAGVSHALVSHYFGSYDALVEETLARRIAKMREATLRDLALVESNAPDAILDRLAELATDRVTSRLAAWAMLTGRAGKSDFFSARTKGLARAVDAISTRRAALGLHVPPREAIEFAVVATLTMVLGFGIAKEALLCGLGRATSGPEATKFEADYRARVREFIAGYLGRAGGEDGVTG
jgi:AcrR family transcriptional regulator